MSPQPSTDTSNQSWATLVQKTVFANSGPDISIRLENHARRQQKENRPKLQVTYVPQPLGELDLISEKIERQLTKHKEKNRSHKRDGRGEHETV